ncbi:hypothetical protein BC659_2688 [Sediminibacterium goheungense]|uniref:Uncharacterized protein n=1 Tax=Sediminibacterium goheungense TaxID=1086393 RepID=A0A4R6IV63_9BACT|nr:hypothetical protein BC659_2688 [Sediminibacterium goheungense]
MADRRFVFDAPLKYLTSDILHKNSWFGLNKEEALLFVGSFLFGGVFNHREHRVRHRVVRSFFEYLSVTLCHTP